MTKQLALSALTFCAALAWESAVAEVHGSGTGTPSAATGNPAPAPRQPAANPATRGAPVYDTGTYGTGTGSPDFASGMYGARRQASAPAVLADLVLLRPLGIALTAAGAGLFIGTSPLAALASIAPPHDAIERSGNALVVAPGAFTFMRPLGEFTYQPGGVYPIRP